MRKIFLQVIIFCSLFLFLDFWALSQQSPTSPVARPSTRNTRGTSSSVRGQPTRFNLNDSSSGYGGSSMQQTPSLRSRDTKQKEEGKPTETKPKEEKPKEDTATKKSQPTGTKTITGSSIQKEGSTAQQPPATVPSVPAGGTTAGPTPPGPRTPAMLSGGATPAGATPPAPGLKGFLSTIGQAAGAVGTTGTKQGTTVPGFFDILFSRKLDYSELPDVGEPLTLPGPMTVGEFLEAIHLATNWNIIVSEGSKDLQMNFWIVDKKPKEALEVLKFYDLFYDFDEKTNFMRVYTKEEWLIKTFGDLKPREFKIKNADISYMEALISALLSGVGKMITDTRTGVIYVWDIEDNLNQMEKTVKELDVPLEKKVFTIKHAEVSDVESVLTSMLSPNGSLLVDTRSGNLFVWDSPASLEKMEEVVARLDIPLETRSFSVNYVDVENVADSLSSMISQRGVVQIDPRTNVIIVSDLPTRLERIGEFIKTLDIRLETRTWFIKYADIDFIADQLENMVPPDMGQIVVNDMTHQITVTALPSRIAEIDELIKTWDIKRKQVLIEAFIVEMDTELERSLGINWSYYGTSGNVPIVLHGGSGVKDIVSPSGSGEVMSIGQLPSLVPRFGPLTVDSSGNITRPQLQTLQGKPVIDQFLGNNLAIALNYLDRQNKATILSSPRVVVQDGEEAIFENATRVPYISGTAGGYSPYYYRQTNTDGTGGQNNPNYPNYPNYPYYGYYGGYNRVEFIDVGTILSVVPRITEENSILLDISAEDSSYKDKEIKAYDQTSTVPEKTIRHAETQLRVQNGETVVLGGLRRSRSSHLVTKTPLLGDIPLLGKLFRNPSRTARNDNLLIFITTTIVDEYTHPEAELLTRAEDKISEDVRYESRNMWGKLHEQAYPDRKSEIRISIGSKGTLFMGGQKVDISELPQFLENEKGKGKKKVLLRKSLRAPDGFVNDIKGIIERSGLSIVYDYINEPIVALPGSEHPAKDDNALQPLEPKEEKE